jgi:hypothetical protein
MILVILQGVFMKTMANITLILRKGTLGGACPKLFENWADGFKNKNNLKKNKDISGHISAVAYT